MEYTGGKGTTRGPWGSLEMSSYQEAVVALRLKGQMKVAVFHPSYWLEDWTTEGLSETRATAHDDVQGGKSGEALLLFWRHIDPTKHGLTLVISFNDALSMLILSITKILTIWFQGKG